MKQRVLHQPTSAALVIGTLLTVLLVVGGLVWGLVAPRVRYVADPQFAGPRALPTESQHSFVALGAFVLMCTVVCVVMAVAAWQIRSARHQVIPLALGIGGSVGAIAGMAVGRWVGGGISLEHLARPEEVIMVTAQLPFSWPVGTVGAAMGVVVYTILAFWHRDPRMGRPGSTVTAGGGPNSPQGNEGDGA